MCPWEIDLPSQALCFLICPIRVREADFQMFTIHPIEIKAAFTLKCGSYRASGYIYFFNRVNLNTRYFQDFPFLYSSKKGLDTRYLRETGGKVNLIIKCHCTLDAIIILGSEGYVQSCSLFSFSFMISCPLQCLALLIT